MVTSRNLFKNDVLFKNVAYNTFTIVIVCLCLGSVPSRYEAVLAVHSNNHCDIWHLLHSDSVQVTQGGGWTGKGLFAAVNNFSLMLPVCTPASSAGEPLFIDWLNYLQMMLHSTPPSFTPYSTAISHLKLLTSCRRKYIVYFKRNKIFCRLLSPS